MGLFSKKSERSSSSSSRAQQDSFDDSIDFDIDLSHTVSDEDLEDAFSDDDDDAKQSRSARRAQAAQKASKKPQKRQKKRSGSSSAQKRQKQPQQRQKSSKQTSRSRSKQSVESNELEDYALASEFLDSAGLNADLNQPQYYRKRPKRTVREWWISAGYKSAVVLVPVSMIMFGAGFVSNTVTQNQLEEQVSSTYNPSLRERNADLGKSLIYAYYNGDPVPPASIARGIEWPGGASSEELETFSDSSGDAGSSASGVDSADVGSDAAISATVRNLSLVNASNWERAGSEEEVRKSPALESSLMESLTYSGVFNGVVSNITIMLQTPGAKPADLMHPADNLQPPIMVSVPTITAGKPSVSGAPGTADPGTRDGEFEPLRNVPEPVGKSIQAWAEAYVADDRQSLRGVVQDPQDGNYVGMTGGWSLKNGSVQHQWQYLRTSDNLMVVGISFTATQALMPDGKDAKPIVTDNPQMMEILVDYTNQGTPAVVAWGVSGSASHLKPYQNALQDNEVPDSNTAGQNMNPISPEELEETEDDSAVTDDEEEATGKGTDSKDESSTGSDDKSTDTSSDDELTY